MKVLKRFPGYKEIECIILDKSQVSGAVENSYAKPYANVIFLGRGQDSKFPPHVLGCLLAKERFPREPTQRWAPIYPSPFLRMPHVGGRWSIISLEISRTFTLLQQFILQASSEQVHQEFRSLLLSLFQLKSLFQATRKTKQAASKTRGVAITELTLPY